MQKGIAGERSDFLQLGAWLSLARRSSNLVGLRFSGRRRHLLEMLIPRYEPRESLFMGWGPRIWIVDKHPDEYNVGGP